MTITILYLQWTTDRIGCLVGGLLKRMIRHSHMITYPKYLRGLQSFDIVVIPDKLLPFTLGRVFVDELRECVFPVLTSLRVESDKETECRHRAVDGTVSRRGGCEAYLT